MPVVKDVVKTFGVTDETPVQYQDGTPSSITFDTYKGTSVPQKVSSDSDRPNEEAVEEDVLDGRSVQSSVEMAFSQMIFEDSASPDTIFDTFKSAADGNTRLWLRREGLQSEAEAEIIGGKLGLTVTIGKQRPGREGHRMFVVNFTATAAFGGDIITPEQTA